MSTIAASDIKKVRDFEKRYYPVKKEHDYFKIFSHFIQSSWGTYNLFKILNYTCLWPIRIAGSYFSKETIGNLHGASRKFKFISKNLLIAKYPGNFPAITRSYQAYRKAKQSEISKARDKLASKVAEMVADTGFLIQLGEVLSLYSLKALGPVVNSTANLFFMLYEMFSLKISVNNYFTNDDMQKIILCGNKPSARSVSIFQEIKNADLMCLSKAVMRFALSAFIVLDLLFQVSVLSAGPMLFLSTCSTVLAIWVYFYKESMTYPQLNK